MLKAALNTLTRIHSRPGQIRRPGNPDIYSPCRLTPASYFRFLRGPDTTTIHGREFIIPIDTMKGQFSQTISFSLVPASGTFKLVYNSNATTDLAFNISAANVQVALRLLAGLSDVLVTGNTTTGFTVVFQGFSTEPLSISATDFSTLEDSNTDAVTLTFAKTYQAWTNRLKRADKIIDSVFGLLTIDEIVEMPDLGGAIMAMRVRCE